MKKQFALILAVWLIACIGGCAWQTGPDASSAPDVPMQPITQTLDTTAELVEVHEKDGILRIESIQPGLDTYDLTVTLRSLDDPKTLATISLGEDAWQTGWTTDGFYALSLIRKVAYLYNTTGELQKEIPLPESIRSLSFAILNEIL